MIMADKIKRRNNTIYFVNFSVLQTTIDKCYTDKVEQQILFG